MSGDFGDDRRWVASNSKAPPKRPQRSRWWMIYCALLLCVATTVWMRQPTPTESEVPVTADGVDNQTKLRERGAAMLAAAKKAKLEATVPLPAAQKLEPEMTAGGRTGAPDPGADTIASSTEAQTSMPGPSQSPPEVQQS